MLIIMCYNVWNRIFAENAPKILKKIRQNMNVHCCQEPKTLIMYSRYSSLVEHQLPMGGRVFKPRQIQYI